MPNDLYVQLRQERTAHHFAQRSASMSTCVTSRAVENDRETLGDRTALASLWENRKHNPLIKVGPLGAKGSRHEYLSIER